MIETILLGKGSGYGESIIVKISDGRIGIIDSCVNGKSKPLALEYLKSKNLPFEQVDFVLLTHYHQDHITGIAKILESCTQARFFTSSTLSSKSFYFLIHSLLEINSRSNPYTEFEKIIKVLKASNRKILSLSNTSKPIIEADDVTITTRAPNSDTSNYFDTIYKGHLKKLISSNKSAYIPPKKDFNLQSVVLCIEADGYSILLGSDLEYYSEQIGWTPVISKLQTENKTYSVLKVPHHGSRTGYNRADWKTILNPNSFLKLTPFKMHDLPDPSMVADLKSHSKNVFATSSGLGSFKRHGSNLRHKLKKMNIEMKRINDDTFGQIEFELNAGVINRNIEGTAVQL